MLKSNLNYPYPMLRSESIDYKSSVIYSKINIETTSESYKLNVEITTNDDNINNLLEKGVAKKGLLVKSNAVWFRKFYIISNEDIIIDSKDIYGKVELLPCIVATEKIDNFFSNDFEEEYKYSNITIQAGEFLALGDEYCFDALLDSDIFKNTSSIFEMISIDDNEVSYDLRYHKIVIRIPRDMHQNYLNVANSVASPKSILNSLIVFPVLVSVLFEIKEMNSNSELDEEIVGKRWYKTIMKTIELKKKNNAISGLDNSGNIDNPLLVAQSLTNGLTLSSFTKLKDILEMEGDE